MENRMRKGKQFVAARWTALGHANTVVRALLDAARRRVVDDERLSAAARVAFVDVGVQTTF